MWSPTISGTSMISGSQLFCGLVHPLLSVPSPQCAALMKKEQAFSAGILSAPAL